MSSPNKRRDTDMMKLMMKDYKVETEEDATHIFIVEFHGPADSHYEGGVWKVRVELPKGYPFKSPSIGFTNRIFHPNIDEVSGTVCLDVINQAWSPMFDLVNVFDAFLPQLLMYPNPSDPLNPDAAALMNADPETYGKRVKEYCERYAKPVPVEVSEEEVSSEEECSEDEHASDDNQMAGKPDP